MLKKAFIYLNITVTLLWTCVFGTCVWSSHFRDGEVGRLRERELTLFHFGPGVGKGELLGDRQKTFLQDLQVPTVVPGEEVSTGCVGPSSPPAFILSWHTLIYLSHQVESHMGRG